jgi:predicted DNA-binding protein (UPF0251 family)
MEFVNPKDLKPKAARELALKLQLRILKLENCLDDLSRSMEIAQYTKQYQVTETFVRVAEALLADRLVIPEADQSDTKFTLVEGELSQETIDSIRSSAKV